MAVQKRKPTKQSVRITRDAETGRYVVQNSKGEKKTATPSIMHPDTFIRKFTKDPVVDRVMKRLSR